MRVEGTAKSLDCDDKGPRLTVQVGPKTMSFALGDPARIQLKHAGNSTFDFNCGPQKPFSIVIEYVPAGDADNAAGSVAGAIRRMEF